MSDSSRNSLNISPSTSSKVLPFYFTLNFDRCMSFHGKLFLRFFNPFAANKRAIYKKIYEKHFLRTHLRKNQLIEIDAELQK